MALIAMFLHLFIQIQCMFKLNETFIISQNAD